MSSNPKIDIVLGAQLGDEGKGRLIDNISGTYDIVARCNSGGNAGHSIYVNGHKYVFHIVPSGILNEGVIGIIGNGTVINLEDLIREIETIRTTDSNNTNAANIYDRLKISNRAHIVLDIHKFADSYKEQLMMAKSGLNIGTTKQGIGPVYSTKASRRGLRICDLFCDDYTLKGKIIALIEEFTHMRNSCTADTETLFFDVEYVLAKLKTVKDKIAPMVIDTITYVNSAVLNDGKRILVEGAQAGLLDVDFGLYPFCTATGCTVGSVCSGLGIPANMIGNIYYVIKTYCTRVGNGPFPTELFDDNGVQLQERGCEFGATTGRRRRCGWLDIPMVKWSLMINGGGVDSRICINKLDVLDSFETISVGVSYKLNGVEYKGFPADLDELAQIEVVYEYFEGWLCDTKGITRWEQLPINAQKFIKRIEELLGIKIGWIGTGAKREDIIVCV